MTLTKKDLDEGAQLESEATKPRNEHRMCRQEHTYVTDGAAPGRCWCGELPAIVKVSKERFHIQIKLESEVERLRNALHEVEFGQAECNNHCAKRSGGRHMLGEEMHCVCCDMAAPTGHLKSCEVFKALAEGQGEDDG